MSADSGESHEVLIQMLGRFSVRVGETIIPEEAWHSKRGRALVKLLALAQGHSLKRDQAIEALWPDANLQSAANNLYQALHSARSVLEAYHAGSLRLEDGTLSLTGGSHTILWVDLDRFAEDAARAKDTQEPELVRAAIAWYQGDLLPEDLYEEWTLQPRETLHQTYLKLLVDLAHLEESRQNYPAGIAALQQVLSSDQSYEDAHVGLMRLYALAGQRQKALRQYQVLKEAMWEELETEPSRLTTYLYEEIRTGSMDPTLGRNEKPVETETASIQKAVEARHNLPQRLNSFIGHAQEINHLLNLLKSTRLLTIIGSGGVGKTSLALQVAAHLLNAFVDGVWLIELALVSDPKMIPLSITRILGLRGNPSQNGLEALVDYLKDKHQLLILDNCEHLIDACAFLTEHLLQTCPRLVILATSREVMGIAGETSFRMPSLSVPDMNNLPPWQELGQFDAVRLFLERASAVQPVFALTASNSSAVAQISQRLGGIPLAIELAAARLSVMTPEQIAARLDHAFHLLTNGGRTTLPRQQTLKAAIDWSYYLLTLEEQLFFQRLSVFAGNWTLEAVEALTKDTAGLSGCSEQEFVVRAAVDLLAQLVNKSLVIAEIRGSETCYYMLETIRQYARDRLSETGCEQIVHDWHLAYYARLSGQAEPHLRAKGQVEWLARLDEELDNLRAAMEWSLKGHIELGLQIAVDLMWFWHIRGLFKEEEVWLESLLSAETREGDERVRDNERLIQRARALRALIFETEDTKGNLQNERIASLRESVTLLRSSSSSNQLELAFSLLVLLNEQGNLAVSSPEKEEMLETLDRENGFFLSEYYYLLGRQVAQQGDLDQARIFFEESLKISFKIEDFDGIGSREGELGILALYAGEYSKAVTLIEDEISKAHQVKNPWLETDGYLRLVWVDVAQGKYEDAAQMSDEVKSRYLKLYSRKGLAFFLWHLQQMVWSQGDFQQANRIGTELTENYSDDSPGQMAAYFYQGRAAISQNDPNHAEELLKRAFAIVNYRERYDTKGILLLGWVTMITKQCKFHAAARMMGALAPVYPRISPSFSPRERSEYEEAVAAIRAGLEEKTFTEAWQAGRALSLDQALEETIANLGR